MKHLNLTLLFTAVFCLFLSSTTFSQSKKGWISLFDGKSLDGWKVGENASTFSVEDGLLKVAGTRAHLFYDGPVRNHSFKNFEFKAVVKTTPGSNSGLYIHTEYQERGWPEKGYEIQVNNSHRDWIRSGSLYDIQDVKENYAKDDEWYTTHIIVKDKRIIVKINDVVVIDYTEPANPRRTDDHKGRLLGKGTFAVQGHDVKSVVYYKSIEVKPMPD